MAVEIERKFLVTGEWKSKAIHAYKMQQGYLSTSPLSTTRVRIQDQQSFITIKGKSSENGLSRLEYEYEIPIAEGIEILKLCQGVIIKKKRWLVPFESHTFEVDEFEGENQGLVVAEVELSNLTEKVKLPDFIGQEVTGQKKYYNSSLTLHPYKEWKDK